MTKPKAICVIGARGGSKSIVNKNIQMFGRFNLIELVVKKALLSKVFDLVVFSSDNQDYCQIAEKEGAVAVLRPPEISTDTSLEFEYVCHALNNLKIKDPDTIVMRLQATSPFQRVPTIVKAFESLVDNLEAKSVQIVAETRVNSAKTMFVENSGYLAPVLKGTSIFPSNRQSHELTFARANAWVSYIRYLGYDQIDQQKCIPVIVDQVEGFDIDSILDLKIARLLFENFEEIIGEKYTKFVFGD